MPRLGGGQTSWTGGDVRGLVTVKAYFCNQVDFRRERVLSDARLRVAEFILKSSRSQLGVICGLQLWLAPCAHGPYPAL